MTIYTLRVFVVMEGWGGWDGPWEVAWALGGGMGLGGGEIGLRGGACGGAVLVITPRTAGWWLLVERE